MPDISVKKVADAIRLLSVDAVEKAKSGHPGMPMGCAEMACALWSKFLRFNPDDPTWLNRDRFVLSAGHGSALLYSMLHVTGYKVSIEDIKNFRQFDSITPGHPEFDCTPGVDTSTGPLGQGFANGVGMAIAGKILAEKFNAVAGSKFFGYRVFGIVSDGDLMEGASSEAASIAGNLGLDNLIYLYDDNHISIEGSTELTFTDDVKTRFEGFGWAVWKVDGHDTAQVEKTVAVALASTGRPRLVMCRTHIGCGSPNKCDSADAHGAPLGEAEAKLTRKNLGRAEDEIFMMPQEAYDYFKARVEKNKAECADWYSELKRLRFSNAAFAALYEAHFSSQVPQDVAAIALSALKPGDQATRVSSGSVLQALSPKMPALIGGSADLGPSNNTTIKGAKSLSKGDFTGKNIHFGVRELAMGAIMNGLALNGGFIPYGGTFLIFSDFMKPAIRLAALMGIRVVYVFTHDSVFVGEDGPTHQPIEQLTVLRSMPNLSVIRPADAVETAYAWKMALEKVSGPTALILSRQNLPILDRAKYASAEGVMKGGYVISPGASKAAPVIIATGSEVALALEAQNILKGKGIDVGVVNFASWDVFEGQTAAYRDSVISPSCARRISLEAGSTFGWERHVGREGLRIGIDRYGTSAPAKALAEFFGLTPAKVVEKVEAYLKDKG